MAGSPRIATRFCLRARRRQGRRTWITPDFFAFHVFRYRIYTRQHFPVLPNPSSHFAQIPHHLVEPVLPFFHSIVRTFMKHQRVAAAAEQAVSLALSLSLGALHADRHKKLRRAGAASGEFVCKTCGRAFPTFQALGGHRTSHLRGRHGLALGLAGDHYSAKPKKTTSTDDQKPAAAHRCHVCGVEFETGQALGGHMRRHREEAGLAVPQAPPVLLQLFV